MESIIKKRIVIRLDENKSLTEIPEGIVEQKCFYKIKYMVNNSSSRKRYASPKAGTELYLDLVFRQ